MRKLLLALFCVGFLIACDPHRGQIYDGKNYYKLVRAESDAGNGVKNLALYEQVGGDNSNFVWRLSIDAFGTNFVRMVK